MMTFTTFQPMNPRTANTGITTHIGMVTIPSLSFASISASPASAPTPLHGARDRGQFELVPGMRLAFIWIVAKLDMMAYITAHSVAGGSFFSNRLIASAALMISLA